MKIRRRAKKYLSLLLMGCLLLGTASTVSAQEMDSEEWEKTAPVMTSSHEGMSTRVAWGYGEVISSNPLTGCPKAKAKTTTYSGTAYRIWARIDVIDDAEGSRIGPESTKYNASSVTTLEIVSGTESCFFIGHHEIQDTNSSGTQTATSNKSYR